ncbi:MAG TPA: hypothetical protein DEQ43_16915, partial [Nocardioides bacterium]|nr:hypothetical protein [Nocardioides sp.]
MSNPLAPSAALLGRARRALHSGEALPVDLRDTIRYSWIRSRTAAAPLERIEAPYVAPDGSSDRLVQAAGPILDRFAQQLAGTHVSLVLADRSARVVGRWAADRSALTRLSRLSIDEGFVLAEDAAGTNGIGTALEELAPVTIFGEEHYAESLQRLVCVGVPIRHPLTRRIEGVLDLACPTRDSTGLLMPTALDLGAQIERELSDRSPQRERAVFDEFVARSRSTSAALVAISEQYMVTNAAAAELLEPRDQAMLWEQAKECVRSGRVVERALSLASGDTISARCSPITMGSSSIGVLIEAVTDSRRAPAKDREDERHAASPTGATVSARSVAGIQFERDLAALLHQQVSRVLIQGEAGSGRMAAIRRLHAGLRPDTELAIKPAAMARVRGQRGWLTALEGLLADPGITCAITDLEDLDARGLRALAKIADQSDGSAPLLLTSSTAVSPGSLRISSTVLRVPPLRERREDIPDL